MCARNFLIIAFLGILYFYNPVVVWSYNLSPVSNLVLKMPNLTTTMTKLRSSYFGFSIVLRENSVFIGAPRAQSTLYSQSAINETGAVYKCEFDFSKTPKDSPNPECIPFSIDSRGNMNAVNYLHYEIKHYQWLGATMAGGSNGLLLVCAPHLAGGYDIAQNNQYFHGICYGTDDTRGNSPNEKEVWKIKALTEDQEKQQTETDKGIRPNYIYGEQGFSVHITPNNEEILLGAPGVLDWAGSVVRYNIKRKKNDVPEFGPRDSYYGYSVASGYLDSGNLNEIIYVAASPHVTNSESQEGKALLFRLNIKHEITRLSVLNGTQYGEYFGYAALVEDVNGDNLDDVLITAPFYSVNGFDVGAVYTFINDGDFQFNRKINVAPFKTQSRFGTAISKLGDINRDGYADIAIGAPFIDGHGAVLIYLGSSSGLSDKPSQILGMEPPIEAKMFGHALSLGVDIDGNGFPDLAIGAPQSEVVYIYRSYPVVNIKANIHGRDLELNETEVNIDFCFEMETNSTSLEFVPLSVEIELVSEGQRMTFHDNKINRYQLHVNATLKNECKTLKTKVNLIWEFISTPMDIKMNYSLTNNGQLYKNKEFCENCALLNYENKNSTQSSIFFKQDCNQSTCQVNLKISDREIPDNFTLGTSKILFANYIVENSGDKAYNAKIEIETSINLPYAIVPPNCQKDLRNNLNCKLDKYGFTGKTNLTIGFDASGIIEAKEINILARATSFGTEFNETDNFSNKTIKFNVTSNLEIEGKPNETDVSIVDKTENFNILYNFKIRNNGPSTLVKPVFLVFVPAAYINQKNEFISYIDLGTSSIAPIKTDQNIPQYKFGGYESMPSQSHLEEHLIKDQKLLPENTAITLYCTTPELAKTSTSPTCAAARLQLPYLKKGEIFTIEVTLNINPNDVRKVLEKKLVYMELFLNIAIQRFEGHVELNVTKNLSPELIVNNIDRTPLWVYILAGIGGLILLIIMALGLWKVGFFKRQTKEEMEELINEKIEKARMKAVLESEMLAMDGNPEYENLEFDGLVGG